MQDAFSRTRMLLGQDALDALAAARVAIFGVGGVGGYAAEALARSGVGRLDLIDSDKISVTNLNRQLLATTKTLGKYKVDVAEERILDINPACLVRTYKTFFLPETQDLFDFSAYDYVVDAIDTVAGKLQLAECAKKAGTPIICSMGAGNKMDASLFRVADIYETSVDPLARVMRTECRKRGIESLKVVFSTEPPLQPKEKSTEDTQKRAVPGSVSFVPGAAGLILAGEVVKDLTGFQRNGG
ncbi:MAG: tRNA threonylcarbamoyladenosine dehydratase [Clostridia bacterium]|nr:tRNA threonylcarbamoyladenosine dehydratase [Clostridia bacterium]